jgi:hypothetical protein
LPAAAFQAALSGHARVSALEKRRLKAGGSQDWPPHNGMVTGNQSKRNRDGILATLHRISCQEFYR